MDKKTREAIETAQRLTAMGFQVRSPELAQIAKEQREFVERGGNRAMRRAARRKH